MDTREKIYVLDETVPLYAPYALRVFDEHQVCVPLSVIRKTAMLAAQSGPDQRNASLFGRALDEILDQPGNIAQLDDGGLLTVRGLATDDPVDVARTFDRDRYDVVLVSRNPNYRAYAKARGVAAEPFRHEQNGLTDKPYTGRRSLYVSKEDMDAFAASGKLNVLSASAIYAADDEDSCPCRIDPKDLYPNEYMTLLSGSCSMLGRFDGENIVRLRSAALNGPVYGVTPRNAGQRFALDALLNPDIPLVILRGPAGTAKSFLSMAAGLEQTVEGKTYRRVLLTRPNIKMDADIGYLKGDEKDKTMPILRGLLDNIEALSDTGRVSGKDATKQPDMVESLMDMNYLEMQSMAYMRGRSIHSQFIVVDEMQNSTPTQALSIITRVGEGTKIVLCGDTDQIDAPFLDQHSNGLALASERMKGSALCAQVTFADAESTRSPLAKEAIQRMGPKQTF